MCHPLGKYGREQVWLDYYTVPLQDRGEKRGEGQRYKIVMDFLFFISLIHNLRFGSPQSDLMMTCEGLKGLKKNSPSMLQEW